MPLKNVTNGIYREGNLLTRLTTSRLTWDRLAYDERFHVHRC
jgi:hypothetical protein